jgi:hypothetical protein
MKNRLVAMTMALSLPVLLGGCAVYGPPPAAAYPAPGPVYAAPPVVYAAPPVYAGPPVFFSFGYSSGWGHHGWRR